MPLSDDAPIAHVSLGQVWEYPDAEPLMQTIKERFWAATVPVYGSRPHGGHELIRSPLLYAIDWIGKRTYGICEHEPCAHLRGKRATDSIDVYESLTMPAECWAQICRDVLGQEPPGIAPTPVLSAPEQRSGRGASVVSGQEAAETCPP